MQKKTELHNLPQDIIENEIGQFLDGNDISQLALVSKTTQGLFQPHRMQMIANKLLLQVMHGEQDKAEEILKRHPELLEMTGTATDYSGRTFNTTAFRYALWALDTRYMCNMMLDCLPDSPQGEAIKQALLAQFKSHEQDGVLYQLNGETIHEKHYDFSSLVEALQTYVNDYDDWWNKDAIINQWSTVVGLAQHYVPAHVAQHYCDPDESFDPTPQFNKKTFKREFKFINGMNDKPEFWFAPVSSTKACVPIVLGGFCVSGPVLGVDCGILRGGSVLGAGGGLVGTHLAWILIDLAAMTALCTVRKQDLALLIQRLEGPIQKLDVDHGSTP